MRGGNRRPNLSGVFLLVAIVLLDPAAVSMENRRLRNRARALHRRGTVLELACSRPARQDRRRHHRGTDRHRPLALPSVRSGAARRRDLEGSLRHRSRQRRLRCGGRRRRPHTHGRAHLESVRTSHPCISFREELTTADSLIEGGDGSNIALFTEPSRVQAEWQSCSLPVERHRARRWEGRHEWSGTSG